MKFRLWIPGQRYIEINGEGWESNDALEQYTKALRSKDVTLWDLLDTDGKRWIIPVANISHIECLDDPPVASEPKVLRKRDKDDDVWRMDDSGRWRNENYPDHKAALSLEAIERAYGPLTDVETD